MAIWRRRPEPGTVLHSDRGSQHTSRVFGHRLRTAGLLGSTGRVASSADNTMIESLWSTLQRSLRPVNGSAEVDGVFRGVTGGWAHTTPKPVAGWTRIGSRRSAWIRT
ncbi:MAG: hypothetical protein L0Y54_17975 [Sporichthyaceae bacterium]|nr:hypothetical protein [Sporichthyaceae bacterium]